MFKKKSSIRAILTKTNIAILIFVLLSWPIIYFLFKFHSYDDIRASLKTNCKDCNVVLIVIDTLRQDHLTPYGYSKNTTPFLYKFSNKSLIFNNNYSASNWTIPSIASIITGTYPQHHLVNNKFLYTNSEINVNLDKSAPHLKTIAQYLHENGYKTAGFTGGAGTSSTIGFDKGFDLYFDNRDFAGLELTAPLALNWLSTTKNSKNDKHFIFLHGYDVHGQYAGNEDLKTKFSDNYQGNLNGSVEEHIEIRNEHQIKDQLFLNEQDKNFLINRYDDKIRGMDKRLGDFISDYKKLNFKNPTIFIITSDHGEEWFEHGGIDHGLTFYQEVVKTPLIIQLPEQSDQLTIETKTSGVDLLPSILDLVQIPIDKNKKIDGISLVPSIKNMNNKREVLFYSDYRHITKLRGGIDKNNNKVIFNLINNNQEIYNLNKDKNEINNLYQKNNNMTKWLQQFFWELKL
ncbi:MAG: sulfatase [Candidatus Pacebacteria bacterium]|nr:sulfatase [Candidatus Paceibacterota bacterium]